MALEANEQTLALALGCSGFCVVVCACICCCRDFVRRNRLRELAHAPEEAGKDVGRFNRVLLTGYQAPIRRLDPFASRKTQGNNVQRNYAKVTSDVEDNMDHLMRAYGSLAAEIDPEDRLKLLSQGARRNSRNEPTLWKAARRLESDAGEAPSRDARDPPIKSLPMQPVPAPPKAIPPQVLGKAEELPLNPVPATVQQSGPSHWGSTVSDTLMRHIELPPKLPDLPVVESDSESSEDEVTSEKERTDRNAKFDALDAELTEQLNQSSGFTLDVSSLHASIEGLPKRKTLKRQGSGKDRKGKESQGPRAPKASKAPKGPGTGVSRV